MEHQGTPLKSLVFVIEHLYLSDDESDTVSWFWLQLEN